MHWYLAVKNRDKGRSEEKEKYSALYRVVSFPIIAHKNLGSTPHEYSQPVLFHFVLETLRNILV